MVKVIMGLKGTGKTKQLISLVNEAVARENGSVICLEMGKNLTYDISHEARLIDVSAEKLEGFPGLKGFICGLYAGNYDTTHIFIDNLRKIAAFDEIGEVEEFISWLDEFSEKNGVSFTLTLSADIALATAGIRKYL